MPEIQQLILWNVVLNNGEKFSEGVDNYIEIQGKLSPWNRLKNYLLEKDLKIIEMSLSGSNGEILIGKSGLYPQFHSFRSSQDVLSFELKRYVSRDSNGFEELFTVGIAIYPKAEVQVWVDERNPGRTWITVK